MRSGESLDKRIEEAKSEREHRRVRIPAHLLTSDMRRARLKAIRVYIGATLPEFSGMLRTSLSFYKHMEFGCSNCPMVYVQLAEHILSNFKSRERKRKKRAEAALALRQVQVAVEIDATMRMRIMQMYIKGSTVADIARKLAVRPEIVAYHIKELE